MVHPPAVAEADCVEELVQEPLDLVRGIQRIYDGEEREERMSQRNSRNVWI
jgi:hypothetical protein